MEISAPKVREGNRDFLLSEIDRLLLTRKKTIIAAVDGRCASGKTTLSAELQKKYDCNVFHMDDYFLNDGQRTEERLSRPGENIDHERFLKEVLLPLSEEKEVSIQRYDCSRGLLLAPEHVPRKRLNIVEGVYSLHPGLSDYYDLKVFLDISKEDQKSRIEIRNSGETAQKFFSVWIPLEEKYFEFCGVRERADLIIE